MCRTENEVGRQVLCEGLTALGFKTVGGAANFVLSRVGSSAEVFEALQRRGLIVRPLAPYGMPEYVRITIGRSEENERLLSVLRELLKSGEITSCPMSAGVDQLFRLIERGGADVGAACISGDVRNQFGKVPLWRCERPGAGAIEAPPWHCSSD